MLGLVSAIVLNVAGIAQAQPMPRPIVTPKPLIRPTVKEEPKAFVMPALKAPRWNLSGSMARAYNKKDMARHLANEHEFDAAKLSAMSIGQLWYIHDREHEGRLNAKERALISKPKKVEAAPYCPPGSS